MYTHMNQPQKPTNVRYEVWVNGKSTGHFLVSANDRYKSSLKDTEAGEFDKVQFSLADLLISDDRTLRIGESIVKFLPRENKIDCTIAQRERHYKVSLISNMEKSHQFSEETWKGIYSAINQSKVKFMLNGAPIKQSEMLPASKALVRSISVEGEAGEGITLSVCNVTYSPEKRMIISYSANRSVPRFNPDDALKPTPIFDQKSEPSQPENKIQLLNKLSWHQLIIIVSLGWFIAMLLGVGLGYTFNDTQDKLSEELTQLEDKYKQLDTNYEALKTKYRELEDKNKELGDKNKELEKQRQQQTTEVETKIPGQTDKVDPLTAIQSRNDFQEFMNKVNNNAVWSEIESHDVFIALKKHAQTYSWKVQYFIKPESLFGGSTKGLGKKPNYAQSKKIREWKKQRPQVNNLKDIKKEVDKLVIELKRLN